MKHFLSISRPRFWTYLLGPFAIGVISAYSRGTLLGYEILLWGFYFTFPANLLVYGINDIFDYPTDKANPKKGNYETLVTPYQHKHLYTLIILLNLPFLIFALFSSTHVQMSLLGFCFFSIFYSAPPIRAKVLPLLDGFFNILYVFPGILGYSLITQTFPSLEIILAGTLWCMAMHAYSAIPDIEADTKANIRTIATFLKKKKTLLWCSFLYFMSSFLLFLHLPVIAVFLGLTYLQLMMISFSQKTFKVYKYFPYINTLAGATLFLTLLLNQIL